MMKIAHIQCCTTWLAMAFCAASLAQQENDAHSLCLPWGPPPAAGYVDYMEAVRDRSNVVISGVPAYIWRHGCGPTSVGMVLGYWETQRHYALLFHGDPSTETAEVDQAIASTEHYNDYSLPIDDGTTGLLSDKSTLGGAHSPDNCIADYYQTSWSSRSNFYGWSWFSDTANAFLDYVALANQTHGMSYGATSSSETWGTFTWTKFRNEIDNGRPMVFLVDSDGDGGTDHFVPAIGYRDINGYQEYACFDTWSTAVRWERFRAMSSTYSWGIYGATYFSMTEPAGTWVDFPYVGTEHGTFAQPYNTFAEGVNAVPAGGDLWIKAGSSGTLGPTIISKAMTIFSWNGSAVVGQ